MAINRVDPLDWDLSSYKHYCFCTSFALNSLIGVQTKTEVKSQGNNVQGRFESCTRLRGFAEVMTYNHGGVAQLVEAALEPPHNQIITPA